MKKSIRSILIIISLIFLFSMMNCGPTTYNNVTELTATAGDGSVTLSWTEPTQEGFTKVEITHDQTGGDTAIEVDKGTTTKDITGLTNGTEYTFTVVAVYGSDKSEGVTAKATPTASTSSSSNAVSVVPTAVYSTAPSFDSTPSGRSKGSLTKDKLTQLFVPIFTGMRTAKEGEGEDGKKSDTMGNFLGIPVYTKVIVDEWDKEDPTKPLKYTFKYYWDTSDNDLIDDTAIGYVKIDESDLSSGKQWTLYEQINNPFDPTEKFVMEGSGYFSDAFFLGTGEFKASTGDYAISAELSWTLVNGKKFITVKDGQITFNGDKTSLETGEEVVEISDYNMTIGADDNGATVTESSTITKTTSEGTKVIKQQTVTKNGTDGVPTEAAYAGTVTTKDANGNVTNTTSFNEVKTIQMDVNTGSVTLTTDTSKDVDDVFTEANSDASTVGKKGKMTIKAGFCPPISVNKNISAYVVKSSDMIGMEPSDTAVPVKTVSSKVSINGGAELITEELESGFYAVLTTIDMGNPTDEMNSDGTFNKDTFGDNFIIIDYFKVDGDIVVKLGDPKSGLTWIKIGDDGGAQEFYNEDFASDDFKDPQVIKTTLEFKNEDGTTLPADTSGKTLFVTVVEKSMFDNIDVAFGMNTVPDDLSTQKVINVFAHKYLKEDEYEVNAAIDMNDDGEITAGDYGFSTSWMMDYFAIEGDLDLNTFKMTIKAWHKITEEDMENMGEGPNPIIYVMEALADNDGYVPPLTNTPEEYPEDFKTYFNRYYDSSNTDEFIVDVKIDNTTLKDKAPVWTALLIPEDQGIVFNENTEDQYEISNFPVAVNKLDTSTEGTSQVKFSNFNADFRYIVFVIGYRFADDNFVMKELEWDDYIIVKKITNAGYEFLLAPSNKPYGEGEDSLEVKEVDTMIFWEEFDKSNEEDKELELAPYEEGITSEYPLFIDVKGFFNKAEFADRGVPDYIPYYGHPLWIEIAREGKIDNDIVEDVVIATEFDITLDKIEDNTKPFVVVKVANPVKGATYIVRIWQYVEWEDVNNGKFNAVEFMGENKYIIDETKAVTLPESTDKIFQMAVFMEKMQKHNFDDVARKYEQDSTDPRGDKALNFKVKCPADLTNIIDESGNPAVITLWYGNNPGWKAPDSRMVARIELWDYEIDADNNYYADITLNGLNETEEYALFVGLSSTEFKWDGRPDPGDLFEQFMVPVSFDYTQNTELIMKKFEKIQKDFTVNLKLQAPNQTDFVGKKVYAEFASYENTDQIYRIEGIIGQPEGTNPDIVKVTFDTVAGGEYELRAFIDMNGTTEGNATTLENAWPDEGDHAFSRYENLYWYDDGTTDKITVELYNDMWDIQDSSN